LVQQRAFLQAYNQTAFQLLMQMVSDLTAANQDAINVSVMIHKLSDRLSQGLQRLDYLVLINASSSASPHHIKQKQCLMHINRVLWQFNEESKVLLQRPTSFLDDFHTAVADHATTGWKRKQMELYLVDSFYGAKSVMSARVMLLRKVLKAVMKLKLRFTNITNSSSQSGLKDSKTAAGTDPSQPHDCGPLTNDYVNVLNGIGARASVALSRIDHVNNGLHELLRDNRVVRATYPTYKVVPGQVYIDSLVLVTLQLTEEHVPESADVSLFVLKFFRSNLMSIITNTITLYIGLFLLLEVGFTRWKNRLTCNNPSTRGQPNNLSEAYFAPMKLRSPREPHSIPMIGRSSKPEKIPCTHLCEYCTMRPKPRYPQLDLESLAFVDSATPIYRCQNQFGSTVTTTTTPNPIPINQPIYFTDQFVCSARIHNSYLESSDFIEGVVIGHFDWKNINYEFCSSFE
uniref:Fibrinogen C-terminal domain-containing protein n=1 Tax=Echinostoma caproni TaxID=27848 RepID=A0A183AXN3_9TREM